MKNNPYLERTIIEVVENQLRSGDPPIVGETLERLMHNGHDRDKAVRLIGTALLKEIQAVLQTQEPHDSARYRAFLEELE